MMLVDVTGVEPATFGCGLNTLANPDEQATKPHQHDTRRELKTESKQPVAKVECVVEIQGAVLDA